jgi:hypothetical protein
MSAISNSSACLDFLPLLALNAVLHVNSLIRSEEKAPINWDFLKDIPGLLCFFG